MTGWKLGTSIAAAVLFAGAAVGQAQQAQPTQQAEKTPQAASAAAPAASSTATAAGKSSAVAPSAVKSSTDASSDDSGLSTQQLKEARDDGFKPVTRGKATLYCKSEILVGTAFPMHVCYNADRLKLEMRQEEAERMQLQQMHGGGMQSH